MPTIPDRYLIPKELKLTAKYTERDREHVRLLYAQGKAIRQIAREVPMSRRMIQFVLFPDRMETVKKQFAERQKDGRYRYPTKEQSKMVAIVRNRKRQMIDKLIKK